MASQKVLELARMSRTELESAATLANITLDPSATDDEIRKLLLKGNGLFGWNFDRWDKWFNLVAAVILAVVIGAGPNWVFYVGMFAAIVLALNIIRNWRADTTTPKNWEWHRKVFLVKNQGEITGIVAVVLVLVFSLAPIVLFVAVAALLIDALSEF